MPKMILLVLAAAAAAVTVLPAATATTAPTINIDINVTVTDSAVKFARYRARRGWGVDFIVTNRGRKPHKLVIGGLPTPVLRPGKKAMVRAVMEERGRYPFSVTVNAAGAKHKGWFIVY